MRKKTAQNTHASQSKFSTRSRTLTAKNITQPLSSVTIPQRREGRQTSQESLFLRTLGANETDFYTCSSTEFLHTEKLHDLVLLEEINKIFMEGKQTLTAYTGKLPFRPDAFSIQGSRAAQVPSSNPQESQAGSDLWRFSGPTSCRKQDLSHIRVPELCRRVTVPEPQWQNRED